MTPLHILGAGALGCLFAHRATRAGYEVFLLTRDPEHQRIVTLETDQGEIIQRYPTQCVEDANTITNLLITTKSYDVIGAAESVINNLSSSSQVAVLSNGMGYHDSLNTLIPSHNLIAGTTTAGCTLLDSSSISGELNQRYKQSGEGMTFFGHWAQHGKSMPDWLRPLLESFEQCSWSEDIQPLLMQKLVINAAINPCTALNDIPNGALADEPWRELIQQAVEEIDQILAGTHQGILMHPVSDLVDQVITDTAGNTSSMLADVRAGRQTEHEAILGFLLEQQVHKDVAAPLLTSWLEALRDRASKL